MSTQHNFKHSELTSEIIKAAYYVYEYHGFGYVESVYQNSLAICLRKRGFTVKIEEPITVYFETEVVGNFKADLIVNDTVIVELKAVEKIHPKHEVQLVNYLKSTAIEVGLLINFGEELKVKRKVFDNELKRSQRRIP